MCIHDRNSLPLRDDISYSIGKETARFLLVSHVYKLELGPKTQKGQILIYAEVSFNMNCLHEWDFALINIINVYVDAAA